MSLESIVNVVISSNSRGVTRASFGIPAVIGHHEAFGDRTRIYSTAALASDLIADGIAANTPIYRAAMAVARNSPKVSQILIGKLLNDFTHIFKLTVTSEAVVSGKTLSFTVTAPNGGADTDISYTVPAIAAATASKACSAETYDLDDGDSFDLDVDNVGAATVTFNAAAGSVTDTTSYPCADQTGLTEVFTVDGGDAQTVTFGTATTAALIAEDINDQIKGASASVVGGQVKVTSDSLGTGSSVVIGTGTCALTWAASSNGTGDAVDASAVTASEIETLIEGDCTALVDVSSGVPTISSPTTGASSELDFQSGTLLAKLGLSVEVVTGSDTPVTTTTIATAVAALINAISGIGAAAVGAVITCTAANTNEMWYVNDYDVTDFDFEDTTADNGLATEAAAIHALYPGWYGMYLADPNSKARVTALAAWCETLEKIFAYTTHDTACGDSGDTSNVMYTLKAGSYYRTFGLYSENQGACGAATWLGNRFPRDPGSSTWAYKALSGVTVDTLTASFAAAVLANNGNIYVEEGGLPVTEFGKVAAGEWIDVIRGRDWLVARLRERIFGLFTNTEKVPFTDPGIEQVGAQVDAQMKEGVTAKYLVADPAPVVTVPLVADISDADKIARTLPGVSFQAYLQGAIHIVDPLNGVLLV